MAKPKLTCSITSYGIYDKWDADSKKLPQIKEFTTKVSPEIDIEFGFVINILKGKGKKITYCIYHPDIPDEDGEVMPPFDGTLYIRDNNWDFYLGDTIWAPAENKIGNWRMTVECEGKVIAEKTFMVGEDEDVLRPTF